MQVLYSDDRQNVIIRWDGENLEDEELSVEEFIDIYGEDFLPDDD